MNEKRQRKILFISLAAMGVIIIILCAILIKIILFAPKTANDSSLSTSSKTTSTSSNASVSENLAPSNPKKQASSTTDKTVSKSPQKCNHNYKTQIVNPTCDKDGYTTYVCVKCGHTYQDNITPKKHNYKDYKCANCGQIDKQHTYQYLVNWILKNGTTDGNYCSIVTKDDEYMYSISYDKKYNTVTLDTSAYKKSSYEYYFYTSLVIPNISDRYTYYSSLKNLSEDSFAWKYSGTIQSRSFTENTPLSYDNFYSDIAAKPDNSNIETSRINIVLALLNAETIFTGEANGFENSGVSIKDLGFIAFAQ